MGNRLFRNTMGNFATGVTIISSEVGKDTFGMTANGFVSVSLDPEIVLVSIMNSARMINHIKESKKFAVSFLANDQEDISMQFAGQKKDDTPYEFSRFNDHPVVSDALVNITCDLDTAYIAGDHTLFLGKVTDFRTSESEKEPLLFYKGKYRDLKGMENTLN